MKGNVTVREVPTRVVPATFEALAKFPAKELRNYAMCLGINPGPNKEQTIQALMESGKATLCASLGN